MQAASQGSPKPDNTASSTPYTSVEGETGREGGPYLKKFTAGIVFLEISLVLKVEMLPSKFCFENSASLSFSDEGT